MLYLELLVRPCGEGDSLFTVGLCFITEDFWSTSARLFPAQEGRQNNRPVTKDIIVYGQNQGETQESANTLKDIEKLEKAAAYCVLLHQTSAENSNGNETETKQKMVTRAEGKRQETLGWTACISATRTIFLLDLYEKSRMFYGKMTGKIHVILVTSNKSFPKDRHKDAYWELICHA